MARASLSNNVIILTGASRGIGRELALQQADQGALLALAARGADQLEAVAEECRQRGAKAISFPTDVTDEQQCVAFSIRYEQNYVAAALLSPSSSQVPSAPRGCAIRWETTRFAFPP